MKSGKVDLEKRELFYEKKNTWSIANMRAHWISFYSTMEIKRLRCTCTMLAFVFGAIPMYNKGQNCCLGSGMCRRQNIEWKYGEEKWHSHNICQAIVIKVEWLWNPLDSSVNVFFSFFGRDCTQRSIAFLSFWTYWPIETSHSFIQSQFLNKKKQRIVQGQGASNINYSTVVFNWVNFDICRLS